MLGKILIDAGMNPTVIVGSKIKDFMYGNLHPGKGEWLVLEACEHNAHMLNLSPECIVLTNIEADHLDFYKNLENILKSFETYISHVPQSGFLIYNADDKNTIGLAMSNNIRKISYGEGKGADFKFANRSAGEGGQKFEFIMEGRALGEIWLKIPGLFNVYNAMAAASAAHNLGVDFEKIKKSLAEFSGLWRRFEKVGEFKGAPVISDYGHHPTAIAATILAAHEFYPGRRVVLAFEPHQHHRTMALFADFVRSFDEAEVVVLSEIYNVEGRVKKADRGISSKKLAGAIVKYWETDEDTKTDRELIYCENLAETERALRETIKKHDVVIIMGAGDVDRVALNLAG
jgi:UDP-N-acetylmuramate--alanine ligase